MTDQRVTTLYPSWEYANLTRSVESAQTIDQTVVRDNLRRQVDQLVRMMAGGAG